MLRFGIARLAVLALGFLRHRVECTQVLRVKLNGPPEMRNGFRQPATAAFDETEQRFDAAVIGDERSGSFDVLVGGIEFLVAYGEQPEIGPARRLAGREFRDFRQSLFGTNVFSGLQSGEPDIKGRDNVAVFSSIGLRQTGVARATRKGDKSCGKQDAACRSGDFHVRNLPRSCGVMRAWGQKGCVTALLLNTREPVLHHRKRGWWARSAWDSQKCKPVSLGRDIVVSRGHTAEEAARREILKTRT